MSPESAVKPAKKKSAPTKTIAVKSPPKKAGKKVVTHVARTPEQVVAEQTGQTYHGVTLSGGDPKKKPTKAGVLSYLDLNQLQLIPDFNPRSSTGPIEELAAGIKAEGVLSSLVVRPSKTTGKFDVIAGERRFKACKAIDYDLPIPCIIRTDLIGDDARALAVALAENSEDGRTNLNMIEIGRACKELDAKHKWSVPRIAKETAIHVQRVRRALALVETPYEVQKNIEAGLWSVAAGLEYARLDEPTRKAVKDKIAQATTADDIRKLRKQAERDAIAAAAPKGAPVKITKAGKPSKSAPLRIYQPSKAKGKALQELCSVIEKAEPQDVGSPDYHEIIGGIAALLWDRGDRSNFYAPSLNPEKGAPDYAAQMKDLTAFKAAISAEAAKFETSEDKADEE